MKNKGVAVVPGDTFGSFLKDMIRISYATKFDQSREAMDNIEVFISKL